MRNVILRLLVSVLFVLMLSGLMAQKSVTIVAGRDNTIFSEAAGNSNGSGNYIFAGRTSTKVNGNRRALIYFNLKDTVPANAVIDSVVLSLTVDKGLLETATPVLLHRLNKDWGEAGSMAAGEEGGGIAAMTDDATWTYNYYSSESWSTPGGDYESTPSSTASISGNGPVRWRGKGLADDVKLWLGDELINYGWILIGDEGVLKSAKRFLSRENSDAGNRPMLTVYYSERPLSLSFLPGSETEPLKAYPNPFQDELGITYQVKKGERIELGIYNLLGQQVHLIAMGDQLPGRYHFTWDGRDRSGKLVPDGMYYVILGTGEDRQLIKIMKTR